jgi:hypothetical protein
MSGKRYDISNAMVQSVLAKGVSVCEAARRLGCSQMIVSRVKYGTRKEPVLPVEHQQAFREGKRRCSCCGLKPVMKGNYFLCQECYSGCDAPNGPDEVRVAL